eukprot:346377-Pelagomonas_calceolata.AAC.4
MPDAELHPSARGSSSASFYAHSIPDPVPYYLARDKPIDGSVNNAGLLQKPANVLLPTNEPKGAPLLSGTT